MKAKSDQDSDPYGSAVVWPLDPDPFLGKKLDPGPHRNQCGSETLVFRNEFHPDFQSFSNGNIYVINFY